MAKLKHYIISIEKTSTYEINVDASSEERAIKLAKQSVEDDEVDPEDEVMEIADVYEDELGIDD